MSFKEFMLQNSVKIENVKCVVSDRFMSEDNKPMEWEVRCLNRAEEEEIMKSCYRFTGNSKSRALELDEALFTAKLISTSVVYPDLNNTELQNSYGAMCAEQLIRVMLTSPEYTNLLRVVRSFGNKTISFEEKVAEAKN